MKYKWLNNLNNKNIIVFFNGWGMDEGVVNHLDSEDFDILMFYDYNDLNTNFDFKILENYSKKYLIAWSMGVMIATLFNANYTKKIAVNGTLIPINDEYGIPTRIYELTIKSFSPQNAEKFIKNMFNAPSKLPQINRNFEEQKSELIALKNYKADLTFQYDRVILANEDKIIPTKNQANFWKIEPNINTGHDAFVIYKKWSEIL